MKTGTKVFRRLLMAFVPVALAATAIVGLLLGPDLLSQFTFQKGLHTLNGEQIEDITDWLPADAQLAYAVFFKSGCSACRQQLKDLATLDLVDGRLAVVGINVGESDHTVRRYIEENDLPVSAAFPILCGFPDGEIGAFPTLVVLINDGGEWEALGTTTGYRTAEDLQILAYRIFIGAAGGMEFWGGNLRVTDWYKQQDHHTMIAWYSADYEPTAQEVAAFYDTLLKVAAVTPDHGLYIHIIVDHEVYGPHVAFSAVTEGDRAARYYIPENEAEINSVIDAHFSAVDGSVYYYATYAIPVWEPRESLAWAYSYMAASYTGHSWSEDILGIMNATRETQESQ